MRRDTGEAWNFSPSPAQTSQDFTGCRHYGNLEAVPLHICVIKAQYSEQKLTQNKKVTDSRGSFHYSQNDDVKDF